MIRKARILLYTLIIGLLNAISISCEKDDPKEIAILSTAEVTKTTQTTAISEVILAMMVVLWLLLEVYAGVKAKPRPSMTPKQQMAKVRAASRATLLT